MLTCGEYLLFTRVLICPVPLAWEKVLCGLYQLQSAAVTSQLHRGGVIMERESWGEAGQHWDGVEQKRLVTKAHSSPSGCSSAKGVSQKYLSGHVSLDFSSFSHLRLKTQETSLEIKHYLFRGTFYIYVFYLYLISVINLGTVSRSGKRKVLHRHKTSTYSLFLYNESFKFFYEFLELKKTAPILQYYIQHTTLQNSVEHFY